MELDDELCYCFHVTKRKVLNYIRVMRPRRASQISECGGAGTGCGWCRRFLEKYFREAVEGGATEADDMTPERYARLRAAYIRAGHGTPAPGATPLPGEPDSA
jgi:bacterioferritin-associated ferredoxin